MLNSAKKAWIKICVIKFPYSKAKCKQNIQGTEYWPVKTSTVKWIIYIYKLQWGKIVFDVAFLLEITNKNALRCQHQKLFYRLIGILKFDI